MSQGALDMPDGLRPPFYIVYYRYYVEHREEFDELSDALSTLYWGEENGELSTQECGDTDGWLWRRTGLFSFEAAERAPKRTGYFFYEPQ